MAQTALPAATPPGVFVVRRRTALLASLGLVVVIGAAVAVRWGTGLAPVQSDLVATTPVGLDVVPHTQDPLDTGPPLYRWRRGGKLIFTVVLRNSGPLPVTLSLGDPGFLRAPFAAPVMGLSTESNMLNGTYRPVRSLRLAAGESRQAALVFRADRRACERPTTFHSTVFTDSVTMNVTVMGVFHNTQRVPLGDSLQMLAPTARDCAS
jgi:hypothetical protein